MPRHLLDALLQHAKERPDAIALRCPGWPTLTWRQLVVAVDHAAAAMESLVSSSRQDPDTTNMDGDKRGKRFVYESQNTTSVVVNALACIACGAIEIPIDSKLPCDSRKEMFERSGGVALTLTNNPTLESLGNFDESFARLQQSADSVDVDQASLVLWTSGTTAKPRGVMLSQRNLTTNAAAKLAAVPQNVDDVRLTLLSLSHAYARTCDMGTWLLSGCQWTLDYGRRGLDRIATESLPTMINGVPMLARQIVERLDAGDPNLSRLRVLGCGGAAMSVDLFERFGLHGIEVIQGYGCTETSPVICSSSPGDTAVGCVGPPVAGCETRIVDQRLFVRGPLVMLGYLDDPASTALKIDHEGWLDTGDLVESAPNGQLQIIGRADDVIVLENGYKVHPLAIEQTLQRKTGCEYAVLLSVNQSLLVAIQADSIDQDRIREIIRPLLPAGTSVSIERIDPPLAHSSGELTSKSTPRRHSISKRFGGG
ncbi:class I adenylate-forming enzyme family protein [Aporhodopirellula aestuarii]|uniref:Long-chain fatty acid--CoA ligase n=1 Tax=Aporhodopirellula aestuarii TaxID=2950107 RepID=A0ABT0U4Y5_9BACT|nr:long-chain fatty acid--CoA ligase [Aporhodopirellula aestuarii]MCM2371986.1 long-chain fatty acid--CoA ligase [Aporhodopirellula aestuarii]